MKFVHAEASFVRKSSLSSMLKFSQVATRCEQAIVTNTEMSETCEIKFFI